MGCQAARLSVSAAQAASDAQRRRQAAFGLAARASVAAGWTALALAVALSLFGTILQLSHWVLDISPFTHVPHLPGGAVFVTPLAWTSGIGLALMAAGLAALRHRDIG
jgi:ABC-2 type transport system permease protein